MERNERLTRTIVLSGGVGMMVAQQGVDVNTCSIVNISVSSSSNGIVRRKFVIVNSTFVHKRRNIVRIGRKGERQVCREGRFDEERRRRMLPFPLRLFDTSSLLALERPGAEGMRPAPRSTDHIEHTRMDESHFGARQGHAALHAHAWVQGCS